MVRKCSYCDRPAKKYYEGNKIKGYAKTCCEVCKKAQKYLEIYQ